MISEITRLEAEAGSKGVVMLSWSRRARRLGGRAAPALLLSSWLMLLPSALADYVLVHELCHLRHMDHSRRFWARVGRFEPDYKRLDKSLGESWKSIPSSRSPGFFRAQSKFCEAAESWSCRRIPSTA